MSQPAPLALIPAIAAGPVSEGAFALDLPGAPERFAAVPGGSGITRFSMLDAIGIEGAAGTARLTVEIALPPDAGPGTAPLDARVTYQPEGRRHDWQTPAVPPPGAIVLDEVALRGPAPRLAGRIRVTLWRCALVNLGAFRREPPVQRVANARLRGKEDERRSRRRGHHRHRGAEDEPEVKAPGQRHHPPPGSDSAMPRMPDTATPRVAMGVAHS